LVEVAVVGHLILDLHELFSDIHLLFN
jgi:hypothetical protein